jgi:alcohol dehydrogenase class IV
VRSAAGQEGLMRYATVARILTGRADAIPEDGAEWVAHLCGDLEIRPLGAYGVRPADIPALADKAARASSMKANPIVLTPAQLEELLARAI